MRVRLFYSILCNLWEYSEDFKILASYRQERGENEQRHFQIKL